VPDLRDRLQQALDGRYRLERELGRGGMATVFLAHDLRHGRSVALKVLHVELALALGPERFLREIQVTARLDHPHILSMHDSGEDAGLLWYTMPFVDGESLRDRLRREVQLPLEDALRIAREVADALQYAHEQGIIHRDIKPENILLSGAHARVADFGIARAVAAAGDNELTATGMAVGTPAYMSPEQALAGAVDTRSDVYALGCVLYEMLAGEAPFTGPTPQAITARRLTDPVPSVQRLRNVPDFIDAVLARALARAPADRFQTARDFERALALPAGTATAVPSSSRVASADAAPRRRRWGRLTALAGLVGTAGVAVVLGLRLWGRSEPPPSRPRWVLVADLDGPPGDRALATAVRELVTAALEQSKTVVPMPRQQLEQVMRSAGLPDTALLRGSLARELAVRASVRAILGGSVLPVGRDRYAVVLRVVEPDSGATLVTATRTAEERDLVPAVQQAAREIREGLGERGGLLGVGLSMSQVATPSFAAFRKFVEGIELSERGDMVGSNRTLHEALELDTAFALAWSGMATNYISLHQLDSAGIAAREALRRPDRLTEAQRYRLEADAAYALHHDLPVAVRWYDRLLQVAPNSISGTNNRAIYVYSLGRYQEALDGFARAEALEPFGPSQAHIEIFNQAVTLLAMGRDAEAAAMAARLTGPAARPFADYAADLLALQQGRWAAAESIASRMSEDPATPSYFLAQSITALASAAAARGDLASADRRLRTAAESDPSNRLWFANAVLLLEAAGGRNPGALPQWLASDTSAGGLVLAGLWAAIARDTRLARSRLAALERRPESERLRLGHSVTLLQSYLLRAEGRWDEVARRLGPAAVAGELDAGDASQVSSAALRWLMAEAYENLGKRDSAAAMYQRILDPKGTPFTHLTLRGLVFRLAEERREALGRAEISVGGRADERQCRPASGTALPCSPMPWMPIDRSAALTLPDGTGDSDPS
jgi:tetratricopeptide (TPR) repeat protein